jgi:hypothetical protein
MPIEQTEVSFVVAEMMEELERLYENDPRVRNVRITDVLLIVGVDFEEGGRTVTGVQWRVNYIPPHRVLGLMSYVKTLVVQRIFNR